MPLEGEEFLAGLGIPHLHLRGRLLVIPGAAAVARRLPSGLKATLSTEPVCPLKVRSSWPVWASHTFTVSCHARRAGQAFAVRAEGHAVTATAPLRARSSWPVWASHTFTVRSPGSAGQALAVRAEGHAVDAADVPLEGEAAPAWHSR